MIHTVHMVLSTSVLSTDRVNMRRVNPYFWTLVTPGVAKSHNEHFFYRCIDCIIHGINAINHDKQYSNDSAYIITSTVL